LRPQLKRDPLGRSTHRESEVRPIPILESLEGRAAWEIARQFVRVVPRALARRRFKRFFGPGALTGSHVSGVVDPYHHPADRSVGPRYVKRSLGRGPDLRVYGADLVLGVSTMRFVSYATAAFSAISGSSRPLSIITDYDAFPHWDGTYICYGSSDTNLKTREIEALPEQHYFKLVFGTDGNRCWVVDGKRFGAEENEDHGILLRMKNPHSPHHLLFVCAGLGEWGSSGAAFYLFNRWSELYRRFGTGDFCCVVRVTLGSDQTGRIAHAVTNAAA